MSDKSSPETTATTPKRPLTAPSFMRPQHPVLDEPLEPDGTKRHSGGLDQAEEVPAAVPVNQAVIVNEPALGSEPEVDTPEEEINAEAAPVGVMPAEPEIAKPETVETEEPAADAAEPAADPPAANPEDVQALLEQLHSAALAEPAGKRRLSPFQGLILALLAVLVLLVLAMVFLYISGMIQLPPVMMNMIDKGLELVH